MRRAMPGAAIDIGDAGKGGAKLLVEQREVGAGEDDGVDPLAAGRVEHRLRRRASTASTLTSLAGELGLGELDQLGRAVADDRAVGGEFRGEVVDIGLAHGRFGAEHADDAASSTSRPRA